MVMGPRPLGKNWLNCSGLFVYVWIVGKVM